MEGRGPDGQMYPGVPTRVPHPHYPHQQGVGDRRPVGSRWGTFRASYVLPVARLGPSSIPILLPPTGRSTCADHIGRRTVWPIEHGPIPVELAGTLCPDAAGQYHLGLLEHRSRKFACVRQRAALGREHLLLGSLSCCASLEHRTRCRQLAGALSHITPVIRARTPEQGP